MIVRPLWAGLSGGPIERPERKDPESASGARGLPLQGRPRAGALRRQGQEPLAAGSGTTSPADSTRASSTSSWSAAADLDVDPHRHRGRGPAARVLARPPAPAPFQRRAQGRQELPVRADQRAGGVPAALGHPPGPERRRALPGPVHRREGSCAARCARSGGSSRCARAGTSRTTGARTGPCLYFHIRRCVGPCTTRARVDAGEYRALVEGLLLVPHRARRRAARRGCAARWRRPRAARQFERAARRRDQLRLLERSRAPQKVVERRGARRRRARRSRATARRAAVATLLRARRARGGQGDADARARRGRSDDATVLASVPDPALPRPDRDPAPDRGRGARRPDADGDARGARAARRAIRSSSSCRSARPRAASSSRDRGAQRRAGARGPRRRARPDGARASRRRCSSCSACSGCRRRRIASCASTSRTSGPRARSPRSSRARTARPQESLYRRMRIRQPGPDDFAHDPRGGRALLDPRRVRRAAAARPRGGGRRPRPGARRARGARPRRAPCRSPLDRAREARGGRSCARAGRRSGCRGAAPRCARCSGCATKRIASGSPTTAALRTPRADRERARPACPASGPRGARRCSRRSARSRRCARRPPEEIARARAAFRCTLAAPRRRAPRRRRRHGAAPRRDDAGVSPAPSRSRAPSIGPIEAFLDELAHRAPAEPEHARRLCSATSPTTSPSPRATARRRGARRRRPSSTPTSPRSPKRGLAAAHGGAPPLGAARLPRASSRGTDARRRSARAAAAAAPRAPAPARALDRRDRAPARAAPRATTPLALRDRAMLELATRAGCGSPSCSALERARLDLADRSGARSPARATRSGSCPFGRAAASARSRDYLERGRARGCAPSAARHDRVFVNARGGALSRMGFWKILRGHARAAGIDGARPSARAAPFVRHASAAGRRRPARRAGAARPRVGGDDRRSTPIWTGVISGRCTAPSIRGRERGGQATGTWRSGRSSACCGAGGGRRLLAMAASRCRREHDRAAAAPGRSGSACRAQYGIAAKSGLARHRLRRRPRTRRALRYRMRYERALGLSFESQRFDARGRAAFDGSDPDADATTALAVHLGVEFYQMFGTRTRTTRMLSVGAGSRRRRSKLNSARRSSSRCLDVPTDGRRPLRERGRGDRALLLAELGLRPLGAATWRCSRTARRTTTSRPRWA